MIKLLLLLAVLPVFKGYEAPRYQKHDELIEELVAEFNSDRAAAAASTEAQAKGIPTLDPALVKAHMIQETGGGDPRSRAAWEVDPLQVNVPGDWGPYKKYLGLSKPRHRNEGSIRQNLRAGIRHLARKGFGVSGQPAANRPKGMFDGWPKSVKRYNGRSDKLPSGIIYSDAYSHRIFDRRDYPAAFAPIELKK